MIITRNWLLFNMLNFCIQLLFTVRKKDQWEKIIHMMPYAGPLKAPQAMFILINTHTTRKHSE